jgi:uncharacterized membrane protein YfcA
LSLITYFLAFTLVGVIAGVMSGMFGIGGGSVRIPLLNIIGLELITSFGINLVVIPVSSFVGAYSQKENIDWDIVRYVILGGIFGSVIGALLTGFISPIALAVIFFIVSILTIIGIYFDTLFPKLSKKIANLSHLGCTIVVGTFSLNVLTGMRGGSGGSLFPSFLRMMKLDIHKAIATSLFATIFTALTAVVIYWFRGNFEFLPAIAVIIGSMTGVRIGSGLSLKTKPMWLEAGLAILISLLALLIVFKALLL